MLQDTKLDLQNEVDHRGRDKVERYNWGAIGKPGKFSHIDKRALKVDHTYQRDDVSEEKIATITANFTWAAFGVILVVKRPDGTYVIYDGQHRMLASLRRSDVKTLPCLIFEFGSVEQEAEFFLKVNNARKSMNALDKQKAKRVSGDKEAIELDDLIAEYGYRFGKDEGKGVIRCVSACNKYFKANPEAFKKTLALCADLSYGMTFSHIVLRGLFWLATHSETDIFAPKLRERFISIGHDALVKAASDHMIRIGKGGEAIQAYGIAILFNKGLGKKRGQFIDLPDKE